LYAQGRYEEAENFSRISEEAADGDEVERIGWGPTRAKILARRGEMEEAERLARDVVKLVSDTDDVLDRSHALLGLAEVILLAGRLEEAIPLMKESLSLYETKGVVPLADRVRELLTQFESAV
jgi:ATP/maltotriose-dependent transcriptional regulator MalT